MALLPNLLNEITLFVLSGLVNCIILYWKPLRILQVSELQSHEAAKRWPACCNTIACAKMLTCGLNWSWRHHESKQVISWPREVSDVITLKNIGKSGDCNRIYLHYYISPVCQWRGCHLYDLRSPNKKIPDFHVVTVHDLPPHVTFWSNRSKNVDSIEGQSLACITSINLNWWPNLTWSGPTNLTSAKM